MRILTYNIQVAIGSCRYRHYLLHGWKHVMPHGQTLPNLDRIAEVIAPYDIVAIQEADGGSLRTRFVNETCYLADEAGFGSWKSVVTRDHGIFAQHTNSLLSRPTPLRVESHRLPGAMEGRGVLEADFDIDGRVVTVFCTHLALKCRTRLRQIHALIQRINQRESAILLGDFNCQPGSPAIRALLTETRLRPGRWQPASYPSWRPRRVIDHILATDDLALDNLQATPALLSDHLPVSAQVRLRRPVAVAA